MVVANPRRRCRRARRSAPRLDGGALEPETVSLPARHRGRGRPRPPGPGRASASRSRSTRRVPIVAESLVALRVADPDARSAASRRRSARTAPARRWVDRAGPRDRRRRSDLVAVLNPGRARGRRSGSAVAARPASHRRRRTRSSVALAPGKRAVLDLGRRSRFPPTRSSWSTPPGRSSSSASRRRCPASSVPAPSPTSTAEPPHRSRAGAYRRSVIAPDRRSVRRCSRRGGRRRVRARAPAQGDGAPIRDTYPVPRQLYRADFPQPDAPWLVALFSSRTCDSCASMREKVLALGVVRGRGRATSSSPPTRELHERYEISGVPMVLIADAEGVVRRVVRRPGDRDRPLGRRRRSPHRRSSLEP